MGSTQLQQPVTASVATRTLALLVRIFHVLKCVPHMVSVFLRMYTSAPRPRVAWAVCPYWFKQHTRLRIMG